MPNPTTRSSHRQHLVPQPVTLSLTVTKYTEQSPSAFGPSSLALDLTAPNYTEWRHAAPLPPRPSPWACMPIGSCPSSQRLRLTSPFLADRPSGGHEHDVVDCPRLAAWHHNTCAISAEAIEYCRAVLARGVLRCLHCSVNIANVTAKVLYSMTKVKAKVIRVPIEDPIRGSVFSAHHK